MKRILIVEDEPEIGEFLLAYLQQEGYEAVWAGDGMEAVDAFHQAPFDLILLDILLPKIDGFGVCELIRRESQVPIVMLTALDGEEEQIKGFDLEVDDYVTKPFSIPILLRKIRAVLRRSGGEPGSDCLRYRGLELDLDARECRLGGVLLDLTQKEFDLLTELIHSQGRVLTREVLLASCGATIFSGMNGLWTATSKTCAKNCWGWTVLKR